MKMDEMLLKKNTFSVLLMVAIVMDFGESQDPGCFVSTRSGLPLDKQPLYIQGNDLAKPTMINGSSYLVVKSGENLILACPGTGNKISGGGQTEAALCFIGTVFMVNGNATELIKVNCSGNVRNDIIQTSTECGPSGSKIIEVGFQVGTKWYKLFETCHDNAAEVSAFARHTLSKLVVVGNQQNSNRPGFKKGLSTIYAGLDPDSLYKKTNQQQMLYSYLGTNAYFDSTFYYLVRGHLAPDADFILSDEQFATYFYVNTEPQWTGLNGGNWLAVEKKVRELANNTKNDLEVTTGSFGILELEDNNGTMKEIYLDPSTKGIPVPRMFWKSVYNPITESGIVLLMANNPFKYEGKICSDICQSYGWSFTNTLAKGVIYCCSHQDVAQSIPYMPHANVTSVLQWIPPAGK